MIIGITEQVVNTYDTPFEFPIFRSKTISEDETIYWKFENHHKMIRIHETMGETSVLSRNDKDIDFLKSEIRSVDMLMGHYSYNIIPEKVFLSAQRRLVDLIVNS